MLTAAHLHPNKSKYIADTCTVTYIPWIVRTIEQRPDVAKAAERVLKTISQSSRCTGSSLRLASADRIHLGEPTRSRELERFVMVTGQQRCC
jgi:hypothetical protein